MCRDSLERVRSALHTYKMSSGRVGIMEFVTAVEALIGDPCKCGHQDIPVTIQAMMPTSDAKQIEGTHYVEMGIQPWEIIEKNGLDYWEGAALKYLLRWRKKDGVIDLDKAIHYLEHIKALNDRGHYAK